MALVRESLSDMLVQRVLGQVEPSETNRNPTVLSCGGIFIPRRRRSFDAPYEIITTPSKDEPVKVVVGSQLKSVLSELLFRESLN